MNAKNFAKEFINDFLEDQANNNGNIYYFNTAVLTADPELKLIKTELKKIGYTMSQLPDNSWEIIKA